MFEYVKYVSQFLIIATKSNRKKVNMEEDILKDLLQDYFKDSFETLNLPFPYILYFKYLKIVYYVIVMPYVEVL